MAECPLAWKFKYIDGIQEPTTLSLFLGKQVRAGLEFIYRRRQLGLDTGSEEVREHLAGSWDETVGRERPAFADSAEEAATQFEAIRLVDAYLKQLSPVASRIFVGCSRW